MIYVRFVKVNRLLLHLHISDLNSEMIRYTGIIFPLRRTKEFTFMQSSMKVTYVFHKLLKVLMQHLLNFLKKKLQGSISNT